MRGPACACVSAPTSNLHSPFTANAKGRKAANKSDEGVRVLQALDPSPTAPRSEGRSACADGTEKRIGSP